MDAVLFGALAGALFGALAVAVRLALRRGGEPIAGACVSALVGCGLAALVAAAASVRPGDIEPRSLWPFAVAGAVVPGLSQILFVRSVRDAGPARAAIVIGTAPLLSALLAVSLLGETLSGPLFAGTVAIVGGGALVAWERVRPAEFRAVGLVLALGAAALFATRDNVVRWAAVGGGADPLAAATVSLAAASAILLVSLLVSGRPGAAGASLRRSALPFVPAGLILGLAYSALLEALDRGPVTVVAPLNGTQSLWAVLLAALVVGRSELIGPRMVAAAALVVAGGALIGISR